MGFTSEASRTCSDFAIAKLDAAGDAVTAFGNGGLVRLDRNNEAGRGLGLDRAGRLFAGVVSREACPIVRPTASSFTVYRLGS